MRFLSIELGVTRDTQETVTVRVLFDIPKPHLLPTPATAYVCLLDVRELQLSLVRPALLALPTKDLY
jgi:hypothetical protein